MKLAPPKNTLQPLPAYVQPAVSQNVQRTASQADLQIVQTAQTEGQQIAVGQDTGLPMTAFAPSSAANSIALWIALALAILISSAMFWFWRSF